MLSLIRPNDDPSMPWLGTLVGVPILGFYFWCTNQFIVQRILAAKSISHARWGALFAGLLKLPVLFFMVFPGLIARRLFPELSQADLVFPTMVSELLPIGIKGLVIAGLLAAIMSSIDSTLNSASTLLTMDFIRVRRPNLSAKALAKIGRLTTVVIMLFSALWVPIVAQSQTLFQYLQGALAYLFPPVVAVFIIGMFWKRASPKGALAGLLAGHAVSLAIFLIQNTSEKMPEIHFLILAGVFLAVSGLVCFVVSLFTEAPAAEQTHQYCWQPQDSLPLGGAGSVKWYYDYRLQSAALLLLTALMVYYYR
jgi:SSS family solute:Na+ symporter